MTTELRIGYLSTPYHTSLLLIGTGWFENWFGIKVSWELFGAGPSIVAGLAEDKLDIGYVGLTPVIIGLDRGAHIKCIAAGHIEGTILVASPEIKSLDELGGDLATTFRQFEGETIGVPPQGSIHDIIVRHLIHRLGMEKSIGVANYKWADLIIIAMEEGKLTVAAGTPALVIAAEQSVKAKIIIPPSQLWPNNPSYGIVTRTKIVKENPQLLAAFLEAHRQAVAFLRGHPDQAAQIVAKVIGIVDKEFVLKVFSLSPRYNAEITPEFIASTMAFIPVLRSMGYINNNLRENDIFDLRFCHQRLKRFTVTN